MSLPSLKEDKKQLRKVQDVIIAYLSHQITTKEFDELLSELGL